MKISSLSRKISARKPSHLGSKIHAAPSGSASAPFANVGSTGGVTGRFMQVGRRKSAVKWKWSLRLRLFDPAGFGKLQDVAHLEAAAGRSYPRPDISSGNTN